MMFGTAKEAKNGLPGGRPQSCRQEWPEVAKKLHLHCSCEFLHLHLGLAIPVRGQKVKKGAPCSPQRCAQAHIVDAVGQASPGVSTSSPISSAYLNRLSVEHTCFTEWREVFPCLLTSVTAACGSCALSATVHGGAKPGGGAATAGTPRAAKATKPTPAE
mmetsp:Transcript_109570/g.333129  ORF Transcript_109570/g.333129 Transcript_109570/m.333129 type:complete len:160 (+) Transcript_109570:495-974(+)